jgi:hypothetical protein
MDKVELRAGSIRRTGARDLLIVAFPGSFRTIKRSQRNNRRGVARIVPKNGKRHREK